MNELRFFVPDGIDDAARVSGGNVYDQRIRDGLRERGWGVRMVPVPVGHAHELARRLSETPRDALVLIDGLIAVSASAALAAQSTRLRMVVLAHMVASALPGIADAAATAAREHEALHAARRVITTSAWTRSELVARALAEPDRITVARPGSDAVPAAAGSASGRRMLCIGAVATHKGQDVLVDALAGMADLPDWSCSIVGSLDAEPEFARGVAASIASAGLAGRIALTGVLSGRRLADAYDGADLVVAPSRSESYGMAVADAAARGIPVVASRVGGLPEAIAGSSAGVLVPPDDPWALRAVLHQWVESADRRAELKAEALASRVARSGWSDAVTTIVEVLHACRPATADEPVAAASTSLAAVGAGRRRAG